MQTIYLCLRLSGIFIAFFSLLGGILGSFGYVLELKGQALPIIDWTSAITGLIVGAVLFAIGYFPARKSI